MQATGANKTRHAKKGKPASGGTVAARRATPKQRTERLIREREEQLCAQLKRSGALPTAKTRPVPTTVTAAMPTIRPSRSLEVCRRLVAGNATGVPAKLTVDLYRAIVELAAYGAAVEYRAAAQIAAKRFGIHTDTATATPLHTRAKRADDCGTAPEALDPLSRLARPRGVFYDGDLDRLTL